ncbi:MAG: EamA family transporter [Candidatus Paceibacterota bacterium]|jgi:drug/metabolite transporter (DMT)-like permease
MEKTRSRSTDKSIIIGAIAIVAAALLWSLDGVFIRPKLYALDAGLVVLIVDLLAFVLLSPFVFLNWRKIKALSSKDWLAIAWVCFFGEALGTLMITEAFFAAMDGQVTFATVVILQKLQPVFALLLARIVLGEKLSRRFYYWAAAAVIAAYFLAFGKSGIGLQGIDLFNSAAWFAFAAAFAFGSSTVFGKRIVNHLNFQPATALRFGIASVLMLAYVLFTRHGLELGQITSLQWQMLLLIIFFTGGASMFIYYFGLKKVTASTSSICELAWPLSAVALDYFLNGSTLNSIQMVAATVMLACFYGVVHEGKAKLSFKAKVIPGAGRGKVLGFPTANLDAKGLDLNHGVYFVEVKLEGRSYDGLMHFGFKETFQEKPSLEVLIKDLARDIYGQTIEVRIVRKIRDVKKFTDEADLKRQLRKDVKENLS